MYRTNTHTTGMQGNFIDEYGRQTPFGAADDKGTSIAWWGAIVVGVGLVLFPEPATTATGLAILAGSLGAKVIGGGDGGKLEAKAVMEPKGSLAAAFGEVALGIGAGPADVQIPPPWLIGGGGAYGGLGAAPKVQTRHPREVTRKDDLHGEIMFRMWAKARTPGAPWRAIESGSGFYISNNYWDTIKASKRKGATGSIYAVFAHSVDPNR